MPFLVNVVFFILASFTLTAGLVFPILNLHFANSSISAIKQEVGKVIDENRNQPGQIQSLLEAKLAKNKVFELVSIKTEDLNDFKVLELELKHKILLLDFNKRVKNGKMRFIVSDV